MAYTKYIFKIIILVQLLVCTFANYGDPDAEFIDFGSPSQHSRDQLIIEAAIKRGMDGEAVAELLRTRKPTVRTTTTPTGFTKTTTYKLEPDGSISSKSILQKRNRYVYNGGSIPDELKNSPTGTVTRTFTDSDGNKVTQTIAVNRDKPVPAGETDDVNGDWYNKLFAPWQGSSPPVFHNPHTYTSSSAERRTLQSWDPERPLTLSHNTPNFRTTSTRTFTNPNGEKHTIQTTTTSTDAFDDNKHKSKFPPVAGINWPGFDDPTFSAPSWDGMGGADTEDSWEIIDKPEVTTKQTWPTKPRQWSGFPIYPTTTTTTTTTTTPTVTVTTPANRKPLPSLDDFLKSQYGPPSNREATTSTTKKTLTYTPKYETTTTPKSSTTTPKFIKVEDLPVVEILHNGKPADESLLKTLPPHLTPRTPNETVLSIEHKHPIEEEEEEEQQQQDIIDSYTPKVETNIRSYSTTHLGPEKPRLKDLDPQMQDILKNAGIVPEIEGDAVTKTRTEPDGRIITTTYKVNTVPSSPPSAYAPLESPYLASRLPAVPLPPLVVPHLSPIADFLARWGLTKFDITNRNGHYAKTIIDETGDVLTATFVLTSATNKSAGRK